MKAQREVEVQFYSVFFLNWTLDRVGGERHASAALLAGMIRYPLYRGLGRP